MDRNVTAIYRTHSTADLVRQELLSLGISRTDIHVIPDEADVVEADGYRRDSDHHLDELHDLHLPEDDLRTYQQSVRRGDYVVSVNVDESKVSRVQEIMRRPDAEAYDFSARSSEFRNEKVVARRDGSRATANPDWIGQPDATNTSPYVRSYRRNAAIPGRY